MYFKNEAEISSAILKMPKTRNGRIQYTVLFKKALCEYLERTETSASSLADRLHLNNSTVYYWITQYQQGLYTIEGTYAVSPRMLDSNQKVLASLEKDLQDTQAKIALVKQCQLLGLQVSEAP